MSPDEYQMTQDQLCMLAGLAMRLNLTPFIQAIEHAHATGPILEPTLYRDAAGRLDMVRELAEAMAKVKAVAEKHVALLLAGDHG